MSKKSYSEQEREAIRQKLLAVGLELLSQRGLKDTKLQDILQTVGISKPFFYSTYYTSLAELVIHIIDYELEILLISARSDAARQDISWEEKIRWFLHRGTYGRKYHIYVMTQEEEMWVHRHLSADDFAVYQQGQTAFYAELLSLWHIPQEKCTPKELGNLILSVALIYNSAARSLPFFFQEEAERTAQAQIKALSGYLASITEVSR